MKLYAQSALIAGLIGVLIFVLIAINLVPTVAVAQAVALQNGNVSANAPVAAMVGLTALIFTALIIVSVVKFLG